MLPSSCKSLFDRMSYNEVLSYMAGIVDGEGCIGIRSPGSRQAHGMARFSLANTSEELIETFALALDALCIVYYYGKNEARGNRQQCWILQINKHDDLKRFLLLMRDRLLVKYKQCCLALRFVELREEARAGKPCSSEEDSIIACVRALNNGGHKRSNDTNNQQ